MIRKKKSSPLHHLEGGRQAGRPTVICISPLSPRARTHTQTHNAPSFKVEVEGLFELVACDCVLMKERLRRGDKAAGRGWEVLAGIRIIRKKPRLPKKRKNPKKTHTRDKGLTCRPPLAPSSLHQPSQLTLQQHVATALASRPPPLPLQCALLFRRLDPADEENAGGRCRGGINANA